MTDTKDAPRSETAQTLSRGLSVLEVLAGAPRGMTLAQVAAELGLGRTIVYRLVATLVAHGFVHRRADGTLAVGTRVLVLGSHVYPALRERARDILLRLANDLGATAHLSVVDGDDSVALAVIEPTRVDFHIAYQVGSRIPLTKGAHNRALLAARKGKYDVLSGKGELIPGAYGVALAVEHLGDIEGVVGVVALRPLDIRAAGARLWVAARELSDAV